MRVLETSPPGSVLCEVEVPHDDSFVTWYLQGLPPPVKDRAIRHTAQIIKSGFFQQLRTDQQLGYVVSAFDWPQLEVPGLVLLIQSPVADANKVSGAMRQFMQSVPAALDEEQFTPQGGTGERYPAADKNLWRSGRISTGNR